MPMAATRFEAARPSSRRSSLHPADDLPLRAPSADPGNAAFEARRRAAGCAGNRAPLERVAALLIAIAKNNSHEGRDPLAIPDALASGFVADLLGVPIAT